MKTNVSIPKVPDAKGRGTPPVLTGNNTTKKLTAEHDKAEADLKSRHDAVTHVLDEILHHSSGAPDEVCHHDVK